MANVHTPAGSGVASCSVASGIEMLGYAGRLTYSRQIDRGPNRTEALNVKGFEDFRLVLRERLERHSASTKGQRSLWRLAR